MNSRVGALRRALVYLPVTVIVGLAVALSGSAVSVLSATLFRQLPFERPETLYVVRTATTDGRPTSGLAASIELARLKQRHPAIESTAWALREVTSLVGDAGQSAVVIAYGVSTGFFELLALPPAQGRFFEYRDHDLGAVRTVVLSERLWTTRFGADPRIIGTRIALLDGPAVVTGIARPGAAVPEDADLWYALPRTILDTGHRYVGLVRLQAGISGEQFEVMGRTVMSELGREFPDQNAHRVFRFDALSTYLNRDRTPLLSGVTLSIALLTLGALLSTMQLLMSHYEGRRGEFGLRHALGASNLRNYWLIYREVATLGAAASVLGWVGMHALLAVFMSSTEQAVVAGETIVATPLVPLLFLFVYAGVVAPLVALNGVSSSASIQRLTSGHRSDIASIAQPGRKQTVLVVGQVTCAVCITAFGIVNVVHYARLIVDDPGFATADRLVVDVALGGVDPRMPDRAAAFDSQFRAAMTAGGVEAIGGLSALPLRPEADTTAFVEIAGRSDPPASRPSARWHSATAGAFRALGVRLVEGREFSAADTATSPLVMMVNEAFARQWGLMQLKETERRISIAGVRAAVINGRVVSEFASVIGVVSDALAVPAGGGIPEPAVYTVQTQWPFRRISYVLDTGAMPASAAARAAEKAVGELEPGAEVHATPIEAIVGRALLPRRIALTLSALCSLIAIAVATLGLASMVAHAAARLEDANRIRMALGASSRNLVSNVIASGIGRTAVGVLIGAYASWSMSALLRYAGLDVPPLGVLHIVTSVLSVALLALLMCWLVAAKSVARMTTRGLVDG